MADIVYPGDVPETTINNNLMPKNVNLILYRGDYVDIYVSITNDDDVVDLSDYTPKCQLRKNYDDDSGMIELECSIITVELVTYARIYLSSDDASELEAGDYIWDFQLENSEGDIRTYFAGDVKVILDVTK